MNNVNGRSIKITRGLACVIISVITYLLTCLLLIYSISAIFQKYALSLC
jgi:hypothetical protein